ncbi:MAG: transglutaminase domain-containing protein [Roseobacter sp.]
MRLTVNHRTEYIYDAPVEFALQKVRLHPLRTRIQIVDDWSVQIDGGKVEASYKDHFGNHVDLVSALPGTKSMVVIASGTVETGDSTGVLGRVYGCAPLWLFRQHTDLTEPGEQVTKWAQALRAQTDTLAALHALSAEVLGSVRYELGHTNAQTTAEQAVKIGKGVCQDHAHIFVAAARAAGLPARYVSGYLLLDDRIEQDASHAWAEVHIDELGWVGFDVSNGVSPDERYVRIATGRDAQDAAPISGLRTGSADESMIVSLQVQQ